MFLSVKAFVLCVLRMLSDFCLMCEFEFEFEVFCLSFFLRCVKSEDDDRSSKLKYVELLWKDVVIMMKAFDVWCE